MSAYWDVVDVRPEPNMTLHVRFADGLEGTVRYLPETRKGILAKLKDEAFFRKVYIECGVVCWPGELNVTSEEAYHMSVADPERFRGRWIGPIDVCPETMHKMIKASPDHLWVC